MAKPKVDAQGCIGCGTCEAMARDVFKMEDVDGKMVAVVLEADYDALKDKIDETVEACPTKAISWE